MPKGKVSGRPIETRPQVNTEHDKPETKTHENTLARIAGKVLRRRSSETRTPTPLDPYILVFCLLLLSGFSIGLFLGTVVAAFIAPNIAFIPGGAFLATLRMFYKITMVLLG